MSNSPSSDEEVPTISCPSDILVDTATGQKDRIVTWDLPLADDGFEVQCWPSPGVAFDIGQHRVVCYAINTNGVTTGCDFTVEVEGMCKPGGGGGGGLQNEIWIWV